MIVAFVVSAVCILVDQLTKLWLYGKSCSLIGNLLWLEPGFNTGASFSMFSNATLFLIIFSVPVIAFMIYAIISNKISKSVFFKISLGILLGGTIGNFIDRIAFGGVRDFIYLKSINFAIFNFADIFINIGVYMLIGFCIYKFIDDYKKSKNKAVSNAGSGEKTEKDESEKSDEKDDDALKNVSLQKEKAKSSKKQKEEE